MTTRQVCRTCLAHHTRMYTISNTPLLEYYEKITDLPANTQDGRPFVMCYICYHLLKKCCRFTAGAIRANEVLLQVSKDGIEIANDYFAMIDKRMLLTLCKIPVTQLNVSSGLSESIEIPRRMDFVVKAEKEPDDFAEDETKLSEDISQDYEMEYEIKTEKIEIEDTDIQTRYISVSDDNVPLKRLCKEIDDTAAKDTRNPNDDGRGNKDAIASHLNEQNCFLDSDSDADMDVDEPGPLPTERQLGDETDITPDQERIIQAEDSANDRALHDLLPDGRFTFDWNNDRTTFKSRRENFTGTPGPTFDVTEACTPTDIFDKMFDVKFIDLLCEETNRYASHKIASLQNNLPANSRLHRWTDTDRQEMVSFLALMILQGLYPLPNEESYFTFNGFGTMPYFSKIMSYNRYTLLKSMLHFTDNDKLTNTPRSRLCKIEPITDYFNNKFSNLYYPRQEIAVDESLLKWHGRLSFAQRISSKTARVGIKTYELCESFSGYLWRFLVYAGKNETTTTEDNNDENDENDTGPDQAGQTDHTDTTDFRPTNATAKIVFDLIEPALHRGHTLIMNNFYNCPLLARCLKLRQTDCYGPQRLNREFIPSSLRTLTKSDLRHGEIVASYCGDLSLMVWRNANLVSMISTYHSIQVDTRQESNKRTYKPSVVIDYNKHMGGIDRKDQYLSAHPVERTRSRVWYKKLFRRLFSCAVFNCFVIYSTKHKLSHRQFRTVLAESLLKTYRRIDLTTEPRLISRTSRQTSMTVTQRQARPTIQGRPFVEGDHFPIHADVKRGRCWYCTRVRNINSRTIWQCKECRVNLCILGCFRDYHKP